MTTHTGHATRGEVIKARTGPSRPGGMAFVARGISRYVIRRLAGIGRLATAFVAKLALIGCALEYAVHMT